MAPKRAPRSKLPAPLPEGHVVKDMEGKEWKLGKKIGEGGFGLIYLASPRVARPVDDISAEHVIKVEYHENGPLFSELKFYQRAAKTENIQKWITQKALLYLGIPGYWGTGAAEHNGKSYRFMVMDRLGNDLQKLILQRKHSKAFILQIGILVLEVLEFMHENEYVHGDIKAANLMLGFRNPDEVYLADYGLSYRYCPNGIHKPYKDNPKKGHNGTIEFTSLDAHRGAAPSRRGDLEMLGYCLLQWLCGELPWQQNAKDPAAVQAAKTKLLDELPNSVIKLGSSKSTTGEVAEYLTFVYKLAYDEKPKYGLLKSILSGGLESSGASSMGLQNRSAAGRCSNVDLQVDCQKPAPKPVQSRVQNKTCEKYAKATTSGIKCQKTQEYNPVFKSESRCRNETPGTKVVLQKHFSKPVAQRLQKKTCAKDATVMMNGDCVKCCDGQENKRLFVSDMSSKNKTSRSKVNTNSDSYQCNRTAFLAAEEDRTSKEDTDGNRFAFKLHPQQNAQDHHNNPRILQPAISATAKAQIVAIVLLLLITFLLLYSDNVQMLLRRHMF